MKRILICACLFLGFDLWQKPGTWTDRIPLSQGVLEFIGLMLLVVGGTYVLRAIGQVIDDSIDAKIRLHEHREHGKEL